MIFSTASVARRAFIVRRILMGAVMLAAVSITAPANANEAEAYVQSIAEKLEPLLQNGHLTPANVEAFLKANIVNELDMMRIARYVLPSHWSTISAAEQQRFIDIFRRLILETFKNQLVNYAQAEIRIVRSIEHEPEGVSVITRVRMPAKSPVNMNWRLFRDEDRIRIFDVSVQGVSKLAATRAEYKSVLEAQGFGHLIKEICSRLEAPPQGSCSARAVREASG
jgi:phospholipid transport system substrate-binding protein